MRAKNLQWRKRLLYARADSRGVEMENNFVEIKR